MGNDTMKTTPHYVQVVQALALAAAAAGCTDTSEPAPDTTAVSDAASIDAESDAGVADVGTDVDADLPVFSGPMAPPDLPSFA